MKFTHVRGCGSAVNQQLEEGINSEPERKPEYSIAFGDAQVLRAHKQEHQQGTFHDPHNTLEVIDAVDQPIELDRLGTGSCYKHNEPDEEDRGRCPFEYHFCQILKARKGLESRAEDLIEDSNLEHIRHRGSDPVARVVAPGALGRVAIDEKEHSRLDCLEYQEGGKELELGQQLTAIEEKSTQQVQNWTCCPEHNLREG